MDKQRINAKIIADSSNKFGNRITSYILTYPRIIHSELMTHRMFSRNSASSRAIPFKRMVKMVKEDPFIPIAWQKKHKGMQGTEYLDSSVKYNLKDFIEVLEDMFKNLKNGVEDLENILEEYGHVEQTLKEWWLLARDLAVKSAVFLYAFGVTKQICNRLLEPFMWHTVLVTATEFDNFFNLRCPQYCFDVTHYGTNVENFGRKEYKSKKDAITDFNHQGKKNVKNWTNLDWMYVNKSQAEIHIQALAESMWDAMNESSPKELKEGEWHIPFGDKIDEGSEKSRIKIATARCARLSYMTFDGDINYEKDIELHDNLLKPPFHASPFEHCSRVMSEDEYYTYIKGVEKTAYIDCDAGIEYFDEEECGWCDNFKGFISYRYLIENTKNFEK